MPQTAYWALGQGGDGLPSTSASTPGLGERGVNPEECGTLSQTAGITAASSPPQQEDICLNKSSLCWGSFCAGAAPQTPLLQRGLPNLTPRAGEAGRVRQSDPGWIIARAGDAGHAFLPFIPDFHRQLASSPSPNRSHWQRHFVFLLSAALSPCLCTSNPSAPTENQPDGESVRLSHPQSRSSQLCPGGSCHLPPGHPHPCPGTARAPWRAAGRGQGPAALPPKLSDKLPIVTAKKMEHSHPRPCSRATTVLAAGVRRGAALAGYPPVGVDDFAEGQLAAHLQVALMLGKV